jgi:hypothetical protein
MEWLQSPDFWTARLVLQRVTAAVYLIAFLVAVNQFRPLLGERGLLPTPRFLELVSFRRAPSIFHLHYSDRFLGLVSWVGVLLAGAAVLGLPESSSLWLSMLVWFAMWALYLSIVNIGQVFYGFGWESLLLETGFLAIFLGPADMAPPTLVLWAVRWLLFRVEFGAGLIKLRGDPCWRDLTCLDYHHETQPLPNAMSWFFHHLPKAAHKLEVMANHVAQLVAPVALFAPQPVAAWAAALIIVTQLWLVASGNFSWLNVLTIALAAVAFENAMFDPLLPNPPADLQAPPGWHQLVVVLLTAVVGILSYWPVRNMASRRQRMNSSFDPLRLVNSYGAFSRVTKERLELVIEGTAATTVRPGSVWQEYEFKAKPGDPRRRPPQVAPYHLRLDWLMWFAALPGRSDHRWLIALLDKVLENDRATLKLLRRNPFPDAPPTFVRATLYHYRFSSPRERRETGAWWVRRRVRLHIPPMRTVKSWRAGSAA